MSRPRNTPGQNVYSGGIGVVIGVVLFIWIQTAIDQASANGDTISDQAWSNLTWWRVAAVLFIVAGGYYLAKGLLAQSKTRETMQVDPNMTPLVECPYCRELVREGAVKCKHCSSGLE